MAKMQTPQFQSAPLAGARQLAASCDLTITREHESNAAPCGVYVNGQYAGMLSGGESVRLTTSLVQNIAAARDSSGAETVMYFAVPSGGSAVLSLAAGRFIPEKCAGIIRLSEEDVHALPLVKPGQAFGAYKPAAGAQTVAGYAAVAPLEKPTWAVWMLCAALLFMLLSAFTFTRSAVPGYELTAELVWISFSLLIAACVCLMARCEGSYRAISAAGLVVGTVIYAITSRHLLIFVNTGGAPPLRLMLRDPGFTASLRQSMLIAVAVCIIALIVSASYSGPARKKIALSAWLAAAVLIAVRIYYARFNFTRPDLLPIRKLGLVIKFVEAGVCIALFALIIYALCAPKRRELITGAGAKVWFSICMLATVSVLFSGIAARTMGISSGLTAITAVTGCIMLLASKRAGFYLMLLAVIMNVATGVSVGLIGRYSSAFNAIIPLAGLLNPLITWLIIRRRWNDMTNNVKIAGSI